MEKTKEDIAAEKIEKWRDDKSMTSHRIARLLIRDFNKTTFKPPESAKVIEKLEDIQNLPEKIKVLTELMENIVDQANNIFKNHDTKFQQVGKGFEVVQNQTRESFNIVDSKFDKIQQQITLIVSAMKY